jgi:hypothetical protein
MSLSNINNGLVFAASPTLPEYPDNAAGTTYRNVPGWTTGTESWGTNNSSVSVSSEKLRITAATSALYGTSKGVNALNGKTIRVKVTCSRSTTLNLKYFNGTSFPLITSQSVISGASTIIDTFLASGSTNNLLYIDTSLSATAGDYFDIEFIYIGDGTYSSRLLDASGNGNHGTVFGATPTADGGISFDGVNDEIRTGILLPSVYSISTWFKQSAINTARRVYASTNFSASPNATGVSLILSAANVLQVSVGVGSSTISLSGPTISDTTNWYNAIVISDGANVILYVNGVFSASIPAAAAQSLLSLYFGRSRHATDGWFPGTIRNPRIYNRVLTAAEIEALATNPEAYNLDRVTRSVTPVPGSVMTRDINGDTQVRRLESTIATGTAPLTVASTTLVTYLNADRVDSLEGSDFVRGTGTVAQTITGVKTFSAIPVLPASDPTTVNQATRKAYIDGKLPGKITISASAPTGGTDGDIWITV